MLQETHYFKIFPEVSFKLVDSTLFVTAPWLSLEVVIEEDIDHVKKIVSDIDNGKNLLEKDIQDFFEFFTNYPLFFIPPIRDESYFSQDISIPDKYDLIQSIIPSIDSHGLRQLGIDKKWHGDIKAALEFSYVGEDKYSPVSLYSYLNYLMFTSNYSGQPVHEKLHSLLGNKEEPFFEVIKLLLRQSFHVTSNCSDSISPAINLEQETKELAEQYVKSEKGHHNLIMRSFSALSSETIASYELFDETKMCMDLLRHSAENCMMSFSSSLAVFESSGFGDEDPIASLLRKSSKPEAAKGLDVHFNINTDESHAAIGFEFTKLMKPVSAEQSISAFMAVEVQRELGQSIQDKLMGKMNNYGC